MRKLVSWSVYTVAVILGTLLSCEILVRLGARWMPGDSALHATPAMARFKQRLWKAWSESEQANPFSPFFPIYANEGFDDPKRLAQVFQYAKLPPSGSWTVPDFLQAETRASQTLYTVHTNSLGFRDPERSVHKPTGTYRIICLGAYQTFGHGVDDEETFPRRLERLLNAQPGKWKYEVWNGGKQGATAIVGLSRLTFDVFAYNPDLLIIEYGLVDRSLLGEPQRVGLARAADTPPSWMGREFRHRAVRGFFLSKSSALQALCGWLLIERDVSARVEGWMGATKRMIRLARDHGVGVILIDQPRYTMARHLYEQLTTSAPGIWYVSIGEALKDHPPSEEQIQRFRQQENWATEYRSFGRPPRTDDAYYVNLIHVGPLGHEVIAKTLFDPIERLVTARELATGQP